MIRTTWIRASVLFLLLALVAPPAFAGGFDLAWPAQEIRSVFTWIWQGLGGLVPAIEEGRWTIDPNGESTSDPTSGSPGSADSGESETDGRSTIDPDG